MDDTDRIEMLETMARIREFETEVQRRFQDGEMPGFVHLYIGEEAVATGVCHALREDDYITSTHRGHGHCIARGLETGKMMAELYGKETGYCNGKGGSMHIADTNAGMLGANGIVAAGMPIAAGAALSAQLRGTDEVAVSFFGDGSISQGAFHETLNLASLWDLPFVGVIENNQYGEMSGLEEHQSVEDLAGKSDAYSIPNAQVDGMDVEAVYETAREAIERARSGDGPTLIECETYRFEGHHEGDSQFYRDEEEIAHWRERDPIETYPQQLIEDGVLSQEEYDRLHEEIEADIEAAVEFALDSEFPDPEEAYEGLYAEEVRS